MASGYRLNALLDSGSIDMDTYDLLYTAMDTLPKVYNEMRDHGNSREKAMDFAWCIVLERFYGDVICPACENDRFQKGFSTWPKVGDTSSCETRFYCHKCGIIFQDK